LNEVGSWLLAKMSRQLVKIQNLKGNKGIGEMLNMKSVDIIQNATQITQRVVNDITVILLLQTRNQCDLSFDYMGMLLNRVPMIVCCLVRNGSWRRA
jgi:hypothetical protein